MRAIPLTPIPIELNDPIFNAIATWSFENEFVSRLFASDVPQRLKYGNARIWAYIDPDKNVVGFSTIDVCSDCSEFTQGQPHAYIPLLAVNPVMRGLGHGRSIVDHFVEEAASLVAGNTGLHHAVFLDVYEDSSIAIKLYSGCGFVRLTGSIMDTVNAKNFFVMCKGVSR